ncbi:hypothetical protein P691DRAFT_783879 [Macrolepiota fuliginosa MF-IS2]|uniref:PH domain-containing protein n=1 Tax=Macrolepiota fuliginosa MF-IS2 TaxID=1400762 RepID=A0A9P5XQP1_9AGAR|nr:hypothetical protein P691DRAFT_783879 [Macrolepiota fuliginosa MF-IS2]
MSPALLSFRFRGHTDPHTSRWSSDSNTTTAGRRLSTQSIPTDKGKEPLRANSEEQAHPVWPSRGYGVVDRNPLVSSGAAPSFHSSNNTSSRPSSSSGLPSTSRRGARGSIFMAASDALGFKFGKRGPPVRQPPAPIVLPDVIEITARKRDEEEEERNRLRAEAAQAIGLDPLLVDSEAQSSRRCGATDEEAEEEEEEDEEEPRQRESNSVHNLTDSQQYSSNTRSSTYAPHISTPLHGSTTSITPLPMPVGRYRSGSLMSHSRTSSANLTPIPAYPSTVSSLSQWQQQAGMLPKYYHPSSLRIFALSNSKNWKTRYIMLTSPTAIISRTKVPAPSYLHLFKGPGSDEKELERLAVNEDSVVFVSDEEVGGRRHVVKIGAVEAGALKKELNHEEAGRTMWFLQIEDSTESQQWISSIKNSILNQRAIRAGLMPASVSSFGVNEPRGDIDVMLSMRAQGFIASPNSNPRQHLSTPTSNVVQNEKNYASSISEHSVRSQTSSPKTSIAVSTLKGLFSGSRPRSTSRATSVDTTRPQQQHDSNEDRDTFGSRGNNLMSMLRSTTPDVQSQSSGATIVRAGSPFLPSVTPDIGIDRKIVCDRQPLQFATNGHATSSSTAGRGTKALSLGSMSLQPPPRKRWTSVVAPVVNLTSNQRTPEVYVNAQYNGTTGSLGALTYYRDHQEPGSPTRTTSSMTGTSENRPRPPSLQSVSTYCSNENSLSFDRSSTSTSTKRTSSSMRRWSRPGSLPPRTTLPSGTPPNPPASGSHLPTTGDANRPASRPSSTVSAQSQQSVISSLPSFSKRASVSSVATSSSQSHSANGHATGRANLASHRASMPPPRPAPTSALPPAPEEHDYNLSKSVDSLPSPGPSPTKPKRASIGGRGFRLSMIAPSKPPPSSNLPPRPDEVVEDNDHAPLRTSSAGNSRLSRLNPIPASPAPGEAPFPPPRGPLPPTPTEGTTSSNNNNRHSTNISRHTSLKQRLRILSAPSSSSASSASGSARADVNHGSPSASSSTSNANTNTYTDTTTDSHTHTSFTSRLPGSGSHHIARSSSNASGNGLSPLRNSPLSQANQHPNTNTNSYKNRASVPPPLASTPSYFSMANSSRSQPATPIGEKIISFQNESSFLNLSTPLDPQTPIPPPSQSHMLMSMDMNMSMSMPIRPLPAIPVTQEMTPLSPPPRRNSKHMVVVERPASNSSPPRTPSTPSIFEEKAEAEAKAEDEANSKPDPLPEAMAITPTETSSKTTPTFIVTASFTVAATDSRREVCHATR